MREKVKIFIEKCRPSAVIPSYSNMDDAGMDIYAAEESSIPPNETRVVPTGLKVAIPPGYEIQIRPRSGITLRTPLRIPNSPGTIDSGYRNEIGIIISNTSKEGTAGCIKAIEDKGEGTYVIKRGDRIAQMILCRVPEIVFEETNDVASIGKNRGGGFGSTGVR
jgi:dUTP pyrophosphatase